MREAGHWLQGERGQSFIPEIFMMASLVVMLALSLDVGLDFVHKAHLQKGVDAAALAGAADLPGNQAAAEQRAREIAAANGIGAEDEVVVEISSTYVDVSGGGVRQLAGYDSRSAFHAVALTEKRRRALTQSAPGVIPRLTSSQPFPNCRAVPLGT